MKTKYDLSEIRNIWDNGNQRSWTEMETAILRLIGEAIDDIRTSSKG